MPGGQNAPSGQTNGVDVRSGQNSRAGHTSQASAPLRFVKVPGGQLTGSVLFPAQKVPGGHGRTGSAVPEGQ